MAKVKAPVNTTARKVTSAKSPGFVAILNRDISTAFGLAQFAILCSFLVSEVREISGGALTTALLLAYIRFKRRGEIGMFCLSYLVLVS